MPARKRTEDTAPGIDFAALIAGAKTVTELPVTVGGRNGRPNPFAPLIDKAAKDGKPYQLGGSVPGEAAARAIRTAIRSAASRAGKTVAIRQTRDGDNFTTTFQITGDIAAKAAKGK